MNVKRLPTPFLCGLGLLVPLGSALASVAIPPAFRLALVVLWLAALLHPHAALVALTILVPFGSAMLAAFYVSPVRYTEALVLATLSGALLAAARRPLTRLRPQPPSLAPSAAAFTSVVACSAAVVLAVTQVGLPAPWLFIRSFAVFLSRDYLVGPPGEFPGVADAALLLEGVALLYVVARHARDGVVRPLQLLRAFAAAGVAAAALALGQLAMRAGTADSLRDLLRRLLISRTSVHIADLNAAGSYFAMAGFVALALAFYTPASEGLGAARSVSRRRWTTAAGMLFAGVWITGSRMAVVSAIAAFAVGAMFIGPFALRWRSRRSMAGVAIAATVVLGALAISLDPRSAAARGAASMVNMRAAFMLTGLRMVASAPLFGVGIGRYFETSGRFMPQSIYWLFFHENAHNNFLQIAGELGLTGLAALVWLLVAILRRLAGGLRAYSGDLLLAGSLLALGAFVATWMTSHPMLVAEVAYPFWILLGISVARADGNAQPPMAGEPQPGRVALSSGRTQQWIALFAVVLLAASAPVRARREMTLVDLSRQSFGFYEWERDGNGPRYRWTSRRAAFFVPFTARELDLPVRAIHVGQNRSPTRVAIAVAGRTLHTLELADDNWVRVRLRLPPDSDQSGYRRIDIMTEPAWSPRAITGQMSDVRVLGVQVGEPTTSQ